MSIVNWILIALVVALLPWIKVSKWIVSALTSSGERHTLHSEVHGILEAATKQAASTVQIRDTIDMLARRLAEPDDSSQMQILSGILKSIAQRMDDEKADRSGTFVEGIKCLGEILKTLTELVHAVKKLDDRLFEDINAHRRIMKALEGQGGGDDDEIIETAKHIRSVAADKGIELSLEQAISRAREQANFR